MDSNDFDEFFEALHNRPPFPWQSRLAKRICNQGVWPKSLHLPTASGKTAALDAALFHLIQEAAKPAFERRAPRRIYFVVDRRLVVDEAYDRSRRVAERLKNSLGTSSVLGNAAARLMQLAGVDAEEPLVVIRLRGGMPLERSFLTNPLQPAIILSTVDQLGSRLLFRGYGVSGNMRPIHAALTAMDSLILIDEAHLSGPFVETLSAIDRYRGTRWCEQPFKLPNGIVQMTATPSEGEPAFTLQEEDYRNTWLSQRLCCPKPTLLSEVKSGNGVDGLSKALSDAAVAIFHDLPRTEEAPVIGIVANRVATARGVFEILRKQMEDAECILLTGRIRTTDRDLLLERYLPRMKAGRTPASSGKALFVVATQTIEVGADLDFDALVTEAASLDALRQRFGRLNRLGERNGTLAAVLYVKGSKDDPIYGEALPNTWKWMNQHGSKIKGKKSKQIDFGIRAINDLLDNTESRTLNMRGNHAPVLMPAHLDALVQTSPSPVYSPDPALLLHGPNTQEEDVQVVWRADLPEEISFRSESELYATLEALPPALHEALSIPLFALQAFLRQDDESDVVDIEGTAARHDQGRDPGRSKLVFVWKGKDKGEIADANGIRPGDVVVLPCHYGGADEFGWFPANRIPVSDVAEDQCPMRRGKYYLRVHARLVTNWFASEQPDLIAEIQSLIQQWPERLEEESLSDLIDEVLRFAANDESLLRSEVREAIAELLDGGRSEIPYPSLREVKGVVLVEKRNVANTLVDDDDSTLMTREISLESHCQGVAERARNLAQLLGIAPDLAQVVETAALFHDLGKADPRFQALLQGGRLKHERILAKSALNASDRRTRQIAQRLAEYPRGQRHECYSVAILRNYPQLVEGLSDPELALYLAGSHHGRGRPSMPPVEDKGTQIDFSFRGQALRFVGRHALEKLDSGWVELFWKMVRRYGYWGLAFLESLVRLADHQRSEWESKHEPSD